MNGRASKGYISIRRKSGAKLHWEKLAPVSPRSSFGFWRMRCSPITNPLSSGWKFHLPHIHPARSCDQVLFGLNLAHRVSCHSSVPSRAVWRPWQQSRKIGELGGGHADPPAGVLLTGPVAAVGPACRLRRCFRAAVLRNAATSVGIAEFSTIQAVAPSLGVEVTPIGVRDTREIERAVEAFARSANGGLIMTGGALSPVIRDLIITLAARHKLPAVYPFRDMVTAGGLASYSPDYADQFRRAAGYVDRILKGAKPADLPVQAPHHLPQQSC